MTDVRFGRIDALTDAERAVSRALAAAVYPPAEIAKWGGNHLEWANTEWCVRVCDDAGAQVSYGGVLVREARANGAAVRLGGIGGVKTHPEARRHGYAGLVMRRAVEFFAERGDVDFALIVCDPKLLAYYGGLGWREFGGEMLTLQKGSVERFTFNRVMTHDVRVPAPCRGTIDLCGPPW